MSAREHDEPAAFAAPDAVQWHEGMLLAPQHLQAEAARVEALLGDRLRVAEPFFWGVLALRLDDGALMAGRLRVLALQALFGDGLALSWPGAGDAVLEIDLEALDRDLADGPAAIHVAVPARSEREAAEGALRRYRSVEGPALLDRNTGDNPAPAPRLRPAPVLIATDGPLVPPGGGYVSLPLAVVARREGRLQLVDYAPPLLRCGPGTAPHAIATEVALALRERAGALAERLRAAARSGGADLEGLSASLRAVCGPLPRLEAVLRDGTAAPYALYLTLCDCLGAIAGVDVALAPPTAPDYVHADALPAFRALAALILPALARLRTGRRVLPFVRGEDGAFTLRHDVPLAEPFHLLLRPGPGAGSEGTGDWAMAAVCATEDAMPQARRLRVRGATRRLLAGPEALDVAAPPGAVAVEVDRDSTFLTPGRRLELRHPSGADAPGAPAAVGLVLPPENASGDEPASARGAGGAR